MEMMDHEDQIAAKKRIGFWLSSRIECLIKILTQKLAKSGVDGTGTQSSHSQQTVASSDQLMAQLARAHRWMGRETQGWVAQNLDEVRWKTPWYRSDGSRPQILDGSWPRWAPWWHQKDGDHSIQNGGFDAVELVVDTEALSECDRHGLREHAKGSERVSVWALVGSGYGDIARYHLLCLLEEPLVGAAASELEGVCVRTVPPFIPPFCSLSPSDFARLLQTLAVSLRHTNSGRLGVAETGIVHTHCYQEKCPFPWRWEREQKQQLLIATDHSTDYRWLQWFGNGAHSNFGGFVFFL